MAKMAEMAKMTKIAQMAKMVKVAMMAEMPKMAIELLNGLNGWPSMVKQNESDQLAELARSPQFG